MQITTQMASSERTSNLLVTFSPFTWQVKNSFSLVNG